MAKTKTRIDKLLVDLGFFDSREKARTTIMMNGVKIAGQVINKPGQQISEEDFYEKYNSNEKHLEVEDKLMPYVSRGAFKLKAAHENFEIDFNGKTILDIGASTGGFTDYALQNGAKNSVALDVGKGQLHYKLQNDSRVVDLQGINFIHWEGIGDWGLGNGGIDMVTIDVSFISLVMILRKLKQLSKKSLISNPQSPIPQSNDLKVIALLKPQFEAGKEIMDKCSGVIKDEKIRDEVKEKTIAKIEELDYKVLGLIESPIKGAKGNIEYLLHLL